MIVVRGTELWRGHLRSGPVLTLGNFDGVHRGHRSLLETTRAMADERETQGAVLTFDPAPRDVLRPDNGIARIQSLERKLAHLERAGVDAVIVQPFDRALAALDPDTFAQRLRRDLGVAAIAVGHDFRFGHKRAGGPETLRDILQIEVREVEPLTDDEGPISSSRIREAIAAGDIERAAVWLGRPHELAGRVVTGDRRGRQLGFPTANIWPQGGMLPPNGVYAVRSGRYHGVANLGHRPTFRAAALEPNAPRLEVHLLDYAEGRELYGDEMVIEFISRLRDEQSFPSIDALITQIGRDAARARAQFGLPSPSTDS